MAEQGSREIGLILEDSDVAAPHFWRGLRAAHYAYGARRDLAGISLQPMLPCRQIGCPNASPECACAHSNDGPTELILSPVVPVPTITVSPFSFSRFVCLHSETMPR